MKTKTKTSYIKTTNRFVVMVSSQNAMGKVAYYCSKRLKNTSGIIELLYCDQNAVAPVQFRSIGELASEEAREEAEKILNYYAKSINDLTGHMPIIHYKIGFTFQALFDLLDQEDHEGKPTWLIVPMGKKNCYSNTVIADLMLKHTDKINVPIVIIPNEIPYSTIDNLY